MASSYAGGSDSEVEAEELSEAIASLISGKLSLLLKDNFLPLSFLFQRLCPRKSRMKL